MWFTTKNCMLWNVRKENSIYIYIYRKNSGDSLFSPLCPRDVQVCTISSVGWRITVFLRESRLVMRWNREGIHPIWSESGKWKLDLKVRLIIGNPV